MCGICGIINLTNNGKPPERDLISRMMGRLRHRGPDSGGFYLDKQAAFGHTRLAIIDLESGNQPLCNEDESIWITFNGEIFNYVELKKELLTFGHIFRTKSDTEVIVHAYKEWGTDCFQKFNGQWALALWDKRTHKAILSRDRLGIRPLYYTTFKKRVLFASEMKALFAEPHLPRVFDIEGLNETFTFWSTVAPRTVFQGINELEPGHFLVIKDETFIKQPYWNINFNVEETSRFKSVNDNAKTLTALLIEASKLRFLRSDVPVGAYLSGGIDSSITASLINNYTNSSLKTFSMRFSDSEFDEGSYQKCMVKKLGTTHRDVLITYKDIGEVFPSVIWHTERPILRTAPAPLYLLSKLVRDSGYKVVVTGEGSDEVLAGYDIFREAKVRRFLARNPSSVKRMNILTKLYPWMKRSPSKIPAFAKSFFTKSLDTSDLGFSHRPRWDTTSTIKMLLNPDIKQKMSKSDVTEKLLSRLPTESSQWNQLGLAQWIEYVTLLSGYILSSQGDRMLMAHSVEGRFPFLDCNFVDFSNNLPSRHKLMVLDEKHLLKIAFKDTIPEEILNRPKQPYRAPDAASFFHNETPEWVDDMTNEKAVKEAGIFEPKMISRLVEKCQRVKGQKMSNTDNMRIVGVLSTMLVHNLFISNDGRGNCNEVPPQPVSIIDKSKSSTK